MLSLLRRLAPICALLPALLVQAAMPAAAQGTRPNYPWNATYPVALPALTSRHHIIPWEELVDYGLDNFNKSQDVVNFLNHYQGLTDANLGSYGGVGVPKDKFKIAADFIKQKPAAAGEAYEAVRALLAWMQGNLVIGPNARTNDPGNAFDTGALNCRQHYVYATDRSEFAKYKTLEAQWGGNKNDQKRTIDLLKKTEMLGTLTMTNAPAGASGHQPACLW